MTPNELQRRATAAELLARVIGYDRGRQLLLTEAAELRRRARELAVRSRAA